MNTFVEKYGATVTGVLSGFDRVLFRGTLRQLAYTQGMMGYLSRVSVLLKDFGRHADRITRQIKTAALEVARTRNRPVRYLRSTKIDKERVAREIAEADGVQRGVICVLHCVESCKSFDVYRNREAKQIELRPAQRKCDHVYTYMIHPRLGFLHTRLQTWFPFYFQVCLNGREWLARQMDRQRIGYLRKRNCFPWIEDVEAAQRLMERQRKVDWPSLLDELARMTNPAMEEALAPFPPRYYWTVPQYEWATDVMFRNARELQRIYHPMVRMAMLAFLTHGGRMLKTVGLF